MSRNIVLRHEFVEFTPDEMEEETVYISIRFATVSHMCLCGCGNKVVTPLRPTDWKLIFDGKTISLDPSIGNWSFPCKSHYWIRNNRVKWAPRWSQDEVDRGRLRDHTAKRAYFGVETAIEDTGSDKPVRPETGQPKGSLWRKIKTWWSRYGPSEK